MTIPNTTTANLPPSVKYGTLTGRVIQALMDGPDRDGVIEGGPVTGLKILIEPTVTLLQDPATGLIVYPNREVLVTNASGTVINSRAPSENIQLVATNQSWAPEFMYKITFERECAVDLVGYFQINGGETKNFAELVEWIEPTSETLEEWAAIVHRIDLMRDELAAALDTFNSQEEVTWGTLKGKPETFPPSTHTHPWASITDKPDTYPPSAHKHPWTDLTEVPETFPPAPHRHSASEIDGLASPLENHDAINILLNSAVEWGTLGGSLDASQLTLDTEDVPAGERFSFYPTAGAVTTSTYNTNNETFVPVDPSRKYLVSFWAKADIPGSVMYIDLLDTNDNLAVKSGTIGGITKAGYIAAIKVPTTWTKFSGELTLEPRVNRVKLEGVHWNHSSGETTTAKQKLSALRMVPVAEVPDTFKPGKHTHTAAEITSGVLSSSRLPAATTSAIGGVRLASSVSDSASGVPTSSAVSAAIADATTGNIKAEFPGLVGPKWDGKTPIQQRFFHGVIKLSSTGNGRGSVEFEAFPNGILHANVTLIEGAEYVTTSWGGSSSPYESTLSKLEMQFYRAKGSTASGSALVRISVQIVGW